jgi:hypothetical protein
MENNKWKMEVCTIYECGDHGGDTSIHLDDCLIDGAVNRCFWDKSTNFEMVHKQWETLYDFEG